MIVVYRNMGFYKKLFGYLKQFFSLLVTILPDKIDISSETCGNYYRKIGLKGLNNHDLKGF